MTFNLWAKVSQSLPATSPVSKWRPRRTLIDLYNERDHTRWYWRMAANLSCFMIMAGWVFRVVWPNEARLRLTLTSFLVYPSAFAARADLSVDQSVTGIVAIILLALGYTVSVALWFICTSWLFQLDVIFLYLLNKSVNRAAANLSPRPCLLTCIFGLFNITYNLNVHKPPTPHWTSSSISALTLATISTLIYTVLSLITFRKIHMVRSRDAMHRHTADADSIHLDPEDEQQRQQLLRLLQQRDTVKKVSSEASQSTFRIDLPDSLRRSGTHLSAPSNVYERSRNHPTVAFANWPPYPTPIITTQPPTSDIIHSQDVETPLDPRLAHMDRALPRGADGGPDLGVPGIVNTRYPVDKAEEAGYSLGAHPHHLHERHPLERERAQYRMETEEEQDRRRRSLSRESRRVEIEMETRRSEPGKGEAGRGPQRGELEGVEVVPRIVRVETDGWGRRGG